MKFAMTLFVFFAFLSNLQTDKVFAGQGSESEPDKALAAAIQTGDTGSVKSLLKDRNINAQMVGFMLTPLGLAASELQPDVVKLLLILKADPNATDSLADYGWSPLHWIAEIHPLKDGPCPRAS